MKKTTLDQLQKNYEALKNNKLEQKAGNSSSLNPRQLESLHLASLLRPARRQVQK